MNDNITENQTRSADGTRIAYRSTSRGPGLVLVPGALAVARDFDGLARELGTAFTVHTIERRGRGASGPQGDVYGAEREVEDILAVAAATGSRLIAGHSFGGFLALEALRTGRFDAGAVYEPGVLIGEDDELVAMRWADRCAAELARGRRHAAFTTFVQGVNPETSGKAPRVVLSAIMRVAIPREERLQKYALLEGTLREHREAANLADQPERYRGVEAPVLLMTGKEATATSAGRAAGRLSALLPSARLRLFPGLDHFGPEKQPALVAAAVIDHLRATAPASSSVDGATP
ncbi:alpha/beta hydrolase [Leifsonia sp. NPDC080035]|uniref:Alpha/beta hydrolase n=1 Tax=Leifsonia sp. NPDC080035 TaxID=3143936 RepID=A0AAU7G7B5_9MICO